jgi:hypothetical protein
MTAAQVQGLLYGECGLKGLSVLGNGVRELEFPARRHIPGGSEALARTL